MRERAPGLSPAVPARGTMRAKLWEAVQKLYAVGILVYFAWAGILALSITDFSQWASFMGHHAVYAFAWPIATAAQIKSWPELRGLERSLP